jgi:subtilisin family serine protease
MARVLIAATLVNLQIVTSINADDFELLMDRTNASKTVSVLVTGWQAITGDEPLPGTEQNPDAWQSITGDEFVKELQQASNNVKVVRRYEKLPVMAMQLDADALSAAKAKGSSIEVWDDVEIEPLLVESTHMIGADQAWNAGYTGKGLAVVVIDSGTETDHPFLQGKTVLEACFADKCPNGKIKMVGKGAAKPVSDHGTHVAGIALGHLGTGEMSGVGPGLGLISINIFNQSNGRTSASNILGALDFVLAIASKKPEIIGAVNMSLGRHRNKAGVCHNQTFDLASKLFKKAGIPVVVASGNDGKANTAEPVSFPACIKGFLSVGAVDKNAQIAPFSNSGPTLDFLAPGVEILSSVPKGSTKQAKYERFPGTSMAAPHVTGAMAVLKQAVPGRSVDDLVQALKKSGTPVRDTRTGVVAPVINLSRAISLLNGGTTPPKAVPPPMNNPNNGGTPKKQPVNVPVKAPTPKPVPIPKTPKKRDDEWNAITG